MPRNLCGPAQVDYRRASHRATISSVARGCSAVGSASPCQGEGRGFESRHPLEGAIASIPAVEWPSGEATACKAVHTGSIPVSTSIVELRARLAQRESASLTRKRSLVQSQYRAPSINAGQRLYLGSLCNRRGRYVKYPRLQTHPTRLEPVRLPLLSQCRVALQFESAQSQCPYRPSRIGVGPRRTRKLRQPEPRCGVR